MRNITGSSRSAWSWIPTLYLAEGVPYVAVMTIAVIMYDLWGFRIPILLFTRHGFTCPG